MANFNSDWINKGIDDAAINFAEEFGKHLCDLQPGKDGKPRPGDMALTTSQIRNFFGEIKRIQAKGFEDNRAAFLLIRPKLAYAEARVVAKSRSKKARITEFRSIMESGHKMVTNKDQFQNFVDFLEATLAYHKFYGGKDN
jgi:CRISPR-associated protein Csm2